MRRAFQAELLKLRRRSVFVAAGAAAFLFAVLTTLVTFLSAQSGPAIVGRRGAPATLESLAQPGGASKAFSDGAGFLGIVMLAVFITAVGFEYARGTLGTALMRQPNRIRFLGGKMAALLVFLAGTLAAAEALGWILGLAIAPARGISTSAWFSTSGLATAAEGFGTALFVAGAWACFGMAVAVFTRSVPIALGIALAWAGPFEHITQQAWAGASRWFPGLLLEAVSAGGTSEVSSGRALALVVVYGVTLTTAAVLAFSRRDVTA
jgi:ABC-type transport system involved in multi-copper enzyme maturation permease subunit